MTNKEINIAIAKACGWGFSETAVSYPNGLKIQFHPPEYVKEVFFKEIPDYCNDLNAMHEAEKRMRSGDWTRYCQYLAEYGGGTVRFVSVHATAQNRAKAFLKTIGKWKE